MRLLRYLRVDFENSLAGAKKRMLTNPEDQEEGPGADVQVILQRNQHRLCKNIYSNHPPIRLVDVEDSDWAYEAWKIIYRVNRAVISHTYRTYCMYCSSAILLAYGWPF